MGTPRRLVVFIDALHPQQPDQEQVFKGPPANRAYGPDGQPTAAAEGFARSCGVEVDDLDKLETSEGSWLAFSTVQPGQPTAALLPDMLRKALAGLPIPKRMRWGSRDDEFVRPVHWVVLLLGDDVVDAEFEEVKDKDGKGS